MAEIELEPENEEEEEEEEDVLQTIRSYCRFTCYHPHLLSPLVMEAQRYARSLVGLLGTVVLLV